MSHRSRELATPVHEADHVLGPVDARVTVVEYGDFECPYCAEAAPGIHLMLKRYARNVRFAFRHFPQDIHANAVVAAEAAESAAVDGRFWEMHDLLFRRQLHLDRVDLNRYAREMGLEPGRFARDLASHAFLPRIRDDIQTGRHSGVRSTPGIFVNGRMLDVAFDLQRLYDAIDAVM